jgi:hypothetical protein
VISTEMASSHLLTNITAQIESQTPNTAAANRIIYPRLRSMLLFIRPAV